MAPRARGEGKTPLQNIRMEKPLWRRLGRAADDLGTDRSALLREFAEWVVREQGARMPKRPDQPTPTMPEDLAE